ncbi:calmodulin-binding transcription activator 2-like isoform X3 [Gossypium arboreum]|uniref:calmodulin-binding transcription activator 2-like isoform X3 n=1 Tax=Gossypium arboreum TaxID=29729 RepID=UPI0022F1D6DC|nr:calmodulin-binding transcription activator 2-like isoform X3 [Gossypium arboreum]
MAQGRRYLPSQQLAGSLYLFDRKTIRYFRKDGHDWRKKKDGKTVREAHEKLKIGSVDVLHCYYAHGQFNENFQRRCYWMLDGQFEHIVFVHYREVKEGYRSGISCLLVDPGSQSESLQTGLAPSLTHENSPAATIQVSPTSTSKIGWNGKTSSSKFEDVDSGDDPSAVAPDQPIYGSKSCTASVEPEVAGFPESGRNPPGSWLGESNFNHNTVSGSSFWPGSHHLATNNISMLDHKLYVEQPTTSDFITKEAQVRLHDVSDAVTCGDKLINDGDVQAVGEYPEKLTQELQSQNYSGFEKVVSTSMQNEKEPKGIGKNYDEPGELKKLDSFGRWMDKEIGGDCDDSLMASDSANYWSTLNTETDDKEVSSLSCHMQLDIDSLGPSLSQEQLFSIVDFSPDWAYSGVGTKVLLVGNFLKNKELPIAAKWGCMFGEIEVSAEVLTNNVIRCQVPSHVPGRVPFYITCSNRLACSEVREFEYREKPSGFSFITAVKCTAQEEMHLQVCLAKLLHTGSGRKWLDCSVEECDKCKLKSSICSMGVASANDCIQSKEGLILNLLKQKLSQWLIHKVHEDGKGPLILDDKGQGVIHLAASLGYEWAMNPIVAAGISPNFRDAKGRTALHWASYFGREEAVIALIKLGASPGAVDDPTPSFPGGRTAADLASSRGHKGIAGYLAEADLTTHLSSLTVNQNVVGNDATTPAQEAIGTSSEVAPSNGTLDDNCSLKGSLAAVRKSVHAAALIQAAFRARSAHLRQLTKGNDDMFEISLELGILGSLNRLQKTSHFGDYLHTAASKIQQKYRGWKGRKEFLKIRNRIVKIQAHVRGHQVRKQYKKLVWSVGLVEKIILRWRRKGAGLRGFRVQTATDKTVAGIKIEDEYEFLQVGQQQKVDGIEKALARVKSMARDQEACEQYMRLTTKFGESKNSDRGSSDSSNAIVKSKR